ncbi:MAG: CBS domain-containing protein [archaeon]
MEETTGRTVESVMSGVVLFQDSNSNIFEIIDLIDRNNADAVVVLHNGVPKGIITESEIVGALNKQRDNFTNLMAHEIMRTPAPMIKNDISINIARDIMITQNMLKLVVKKNDEIIGLLTQKDILSYLF